VFAVSTIARRAWYTVVLGGLLAVLAGCQLDVDVTMTMEPDGSGELVVVAVADAELVASDPGLLGALELPDATAAGWTVEGPTEGDDGGATVTLRHPFATAEEATNLLRSLGPPLAADVTVTRTATDEEVTVVVTGSAVLADGNVAAFADADMIAALGGTPFAEQFGDVAASPSEAMTVDLIVALPGEITASNTGSDGGTVTWALPLDGATTELNATATLGDSDGAGWASAVSTGALIAMVAWLVVGALLVAAVLRARHRRRSRPVNLTRYR